ncbi:MAG: DNA polymerase-3 subunit gamma/tau [Motiliproteus sp.]|jgi:DNA polymerase-3 subunit gamma/tau
MSYQVLARKWRPSTFAAMVGQDLVLQALVNALDSDRLHHAYLFTGTRGVGKTSIARLFAKALNCEQGVSSKPCGECSPCREISEGRFVDLIEVDAASRTKVEDTRELMDNVQYAPTQGRYKVYLIDEVHMLSTHSFNALLKTLEEPPPHVKFLLATTDPKKLPMTILSRCLQFNLKNMVPEKIVEHLQRVLQAEQVPFEDNALWLLAHAANGSMRDALSLTDQAIAFGSGKVPDADVRAMLGSVDQRQVLGLLQQLAQGSAKGVLDTVSTMAQFGADADAILAELLGLLHRLAVAQMLPDAVDNSQGDRDELMALAAGLRAEDVQLFYQIALHGRRDLPHVPVAREGLEMALLRMLAFRPVNRGEQALADAGADAASLPASVLPAKESSSTVQLEPAPASVTESPAAPAAISEPAEASVAVAADEPQATSPPVCDDPPPWGITEPAGESGSKKPEAPAATKPEAMLPAASQSAVLSGSDVESVAEAAVESPEVVVERDLPVAVQSPVAASGTVVSDTVAVTLLTPQASLPEAGEPTGADAEVIEVTFGGAVAARWVALIDQIGLSGMTYNIAANASLRAVEGSDWCFTLAGEQIHLFNTTHRQRLAQALSEHLDETITVDVVEAPAAGETPALYRQRKREERQSQAVIAIENDSNVQAIIANYDARIDPDSIRPVDNGEPLR